jgi:hypothetical protein
MDDPEFQLLIATCAGSLHDRPIDEPRAEIDWDRFLALATRHRVQAHCWNSLSPVADWLPRRAAAVLREQAREIVMSNMRVAFECRQLSDLLGSGRVPHLFVKGLTLGALVYSKPLFKMSMDIDVLIDPDRLSDASSILNSAGYSAIMPANDRALLRWHATRKESVWFKPVGDFQLDLHTSLADHPDLLGGISASSPSQDVTVATGVRLPTLATDELFAYLCVHGASSAWFRLKWITDLAAFLRDKAISEIERLYARSQQLVAGRAAAQGLLLARHIYDTELGIGLHDRLASDPINRLLVQIANRQLRNLSEPTDRPMGTSSIHLSQLGLLPGWRFAASEAVRQLRSLF